MPSCYARSCASEISGRQATAPVASCPFLSTNNILRSTQDLCKPTYLVFRQERALVVANDRHFIEW